MLSKHLPASLAFLLLLFVFCLPSYADDARQQSDSLVTITPEQTRRFSQTLAWAGRRFTAQIDMTGTFRHGFPRQSITFGGVGVNWSLDLDRSTTISLIEF